MKLAILDRDGTLNPLGDDFITSPEEWSAQPGALEAVARLNHAGWRVVVATNQPGLGRGLFDVVSLNAIHAKMLRQVAAVGGAHRRRFLLPARARRGLPLPHACARPAGTDLRPLWRGAFRCAGGGQLRRASAGGRGAGRAGAPGVHGQRGPFATRAALAHRVSRHHAGACQPGSICRAFAAPGVFNACAAASGCAAGCRWARRIAPPRSGCTAALFLMLYI